MSGVPGTMKMPLTAMYKMVAVVYTKVDKVIDLITSNYLFHNVTMTCISWRMDEEPPKNSHEYEWRYGGL
jgi:hypothetical protein